jgi:hypothetical protein
MPESWAEVLFFEWKRVAVIIHTGAKPWLPEQGKDIKNQLSKLWRMLRLGVDTSMLKDRYLEFAVVPNAGNGWHLLLKQGCIALNEVDAAGLDSVKQ